MGSRKKNRLLEYFKDPAGLWDASEEELRKISFLNGGSVCRLLDKNLREDVSRHIENINKYGIKVINIQEEIYPECLKNIYDPPVALYVRGSLLKDEKAVAVVGSRNASLYGLTMAERLSYDLAGYGITIVSGMARGIDASAQKGALKAGGRTIAVLGCGLDKAYPAENKELMERIAQTGAVISEYLPGVPPLPQNFPARNRIISGLSMGTVIIEANEKSGSLITANFALEQGREVFAVPGNITSPVSRGTNKLIKDGAKIVTCAEDILEEFIFYQRTYNTNCQGIKEKKEENIFKGLDENERRLVEHLRNEPLHIDVLSKQSGLGIQLVNSALVMLELKGVVEQMPGKVYKIKV
jgi:DNA processing protein